MPPRRRVTYSSHPNRAARSAHAKAARTFKTYDVSYIQPKRSKVPFIIAGIVALVLIVFATSCVMRGCSSPTVAAGTEVTVTVPQGAATRTIGQLLQENGLIGNSSDFTSRVDALGVGNSLMPGTYVFVGGTSVDDLIKQLRQGPAMTTITVPEGKTASQTAQIVSDATKGRITKDAFMACVNSASSYVSSYSFVSGSYNNTLEGFLFPKTYSVKSDATADDVVRMMLDQYKTEVASLNYAYPTSQGLSAYDVVKLASIIERESTDDNREMVASVFYNRLAADMNLQSDATVAYFVGADPTPDDLKIANPYNTYLNAGLPVGPICSPGLASLTAACNPATTNYLYFYFAAGSDGQMKYYFSETYEEHLDAIGGTTQDDSASADDSGTDASDEG